MAADISVGSLAPDKVVLDIADETMMYSLTLPHADAADLGIDLITHADNVDQRTTRSDGGTSDDDDEDVCPRCGEPITDVASSGPETVTLRPCGHQIPAGSPVLDDYRSENDGGVGGC